MFPVCVSCISLKNWLSEVVHLTCYRICARGLSATIHYHNKSVTLHRVQLFFTLSDFTHEELLITSCCMVLPHFHRENKPQKGGICVANHTSPIDVVILANDGCYAMVGIANQQVNVSFIADVSMP